MSKDKKVVLADLTELEETIQVAVKNAFETFIESSSFGHDFIDETWDRKTTAKFFKVSPEKITEMFKRKEIPGRKIGRDYFFLKSQIIRTFKKG